MKWKLPLFMILASCLANVASVHSQAAGRGICLIVVPTEAEAVELRSRIRDGASFEAMAMAHSTDSSAVRGGYMGILEESRLSREFQAALKGLEPGAISAVIPVAGNFALLKMTTAEEDRWILQNDSAVRALQQGRYAEAVSLFLDAAKQAEQFGTLDVRLAESLNGLAQVYRYQQDQAAAEPKARQSLTILERAVGPSHPAVLSSLVNLAAIMSTTGRYAEAEQAYRRILSIRWGTAGDGIRADQVLENFAEVLSLNLTRDPALDRAVEQYRRSVSNARLDQDLYLRMRDGFVAAQLMDEAEFLMQRAVMAYPQSRSLQFELGEFYLIWGKYENALEAFEAAARRGASEDPAVERQQRSAILERIGEMNFYLVRFDEAIAALKNALEISPLRWSPRLLLGKIYVRRNKLEEAAEEYSRVISADSRSAAAHEGLAQVHLDLGRYKEAAAEAERALAIDSRLQRSRYIQAMALIRGGNEQEGKIALQDYQERESELQTAASGSNAILDVEKQFSILASESRYQEAMMTLRNGIRAHPLNARLYLKLGLIQGRFGLHSEAAETFETMIRMQLDDFLVHRQLSREYDQLGNKEGAQQQRVVYLQRYDAALQRKAN